MMLLHVAAIGASFTAISCSPFPQAEPTCTTTVLKPPPVQVACTFFAETSTVTEYADCGGCALVTRQLGLGIPCRNVTDVPGTATVTVTNCADAAFPTILSNPISIANATTM